MTVVFFCWCQQQLAGSFFEIHFINMVQLKGPNMRVGPWKGTTSRSESHLMQIHTSLPLSLFIYVTVFR